MIQTLNIPYSSKTDEIMSRYRPIAPKPEIPANSTNSGNTNNNAYDGPLVPETFRQSPYLRSMWSHLQARPTRTRKRGRNSSISPAAAVALLRKQQEHEQHQQQQQLLVQPNLGRRGATTFMGLCSPTHLPSASNLSIQAFGLYADSQHGSNNNNNNNDSVVELPLLSCPLLSRGNDLKTIDLNTAALEISSLEERDLQLQLQVPSNNGGNKSCVISPRPIRPVGSSISIVGPISDDPEARVIVKAPEEAEGAAEAEALPAVISDRGNKVRMVNSAYKELVGQPECPWLDSMCSGSRISGEVMLQLSDSGLPVSSNGFSCWVRIEWESDGKKNSVNAFCDVVKMVCLSKDYVYYWRFNTREVSPSGSKV